MPKLLPTETSSRKTAFSQQLPGDSGVWLFITADTFTFCIFFLVFIAGRHEQPEVYELSRQALDPSIGFFNTLILLTSSWFVFLAVHSAQNKHRKYTQNALVCAIAFGLVFSVTKLCSYALEMQHGYTITTNQFFAYYYAFTIIHLLHALVGLVLLFITWTKTKDSNFDKQYICWIESVGCYWHMVDLLWIILFPLLYLLVGK